ncbi:MAG: Mur ligase family protein, partial [Eudoraea sp.]
MTYKETLNWMFSQLPMYQQKGPSAYNAKLSTSYALAEHLNHPQKKFKSIHVAGTNGNGSSSHMLASILQEAGYKVGLYTSPHLKDFRERIKINGVSISEQAVTTFIDENKSYLETNILSFFEMTVGMAFDYFAKQEVDIAIIEVGLGGRLDSTNIIIPEISLITNIGLDHQDLLGKTLEKIAYEKAGIIKEGVPVVVSEYQEEVASV